MGFGAKLPVIGGLLDNSGKNASAQYRQMLEQYQQLEAPENAWVDYSPEELAYMQEFNPEMAQYQTVTEDPRLLSDQSSYLNMLKKLASEGLSDVDAAVFDRARSESGQQARGQNEAVMANMAARGMAGSGNELLSRELAGQHAAERARSSQMEQAAAAAKQRALYEQAYGGELAGQRAAGTGVASGNADIINRFNQLNTGAKNTATYDNLANRQQTTNQNVGIRNSAQQYNQQGRRDAIQQAYDNKLNRLSGMSGANANVAMGYQQQAAANAAKRRALGQAAGTAIGGAYGGPEGAKQGGMYGGAAGICSNG